MTTTATSPAVAYWRRTFDGLTGYIACFSGARAGKKLERPTTKFFPYPHAVENAAAWLQAEATAGREAYAAANLFADNRKRDKRFATEIATLWTDGDGALIPAGFPQPTITVETSPGRWNYLWVLTRPIAPDQAERLNRCIAYAIGADAGGWDLGQLLRVPGLPNYKYDGAPTVTVTDDSGPVHDADELAASLPPAPAEAARARRTPPTRGDGGTPTPGDEPPIRGMNAELWQGKRLTTTDDEGPVSDDPLVFNTGTIDRSRVLWHIACDAEEHGASEALIAWIFEDRDRALGFHKFCDRSDMYRQQARKVIERERAPRATVTIGGRGAPDADAGADDRARAELEELRAVNRGIMAIVRSEATPASKVAAIELAFEAHASRPDDFTSITGIASRIHQSSDSVSKTLAAQRIVVAPHELRASIPPDDSPFHVTYETRMSNPWTGEVTEQPHAYMKIAPTRARLSETLADLAADVPEELRKKERADRGSKAEPTPIPDAAIPPCPDDDAAGTTQATEPVQVARCKDCGAVLAAMTDDGTVLTAWPDNIGAGTAATQARAFWSPSYPTTDIIGPGDAAHRARHAWVQDRVQLAAVRAELRQGFADAGGDA